MFLAWFGDLLDILTEDEVGWALWNVAGPFGVLDWRRSDVACEEWRGHTPDRKLLDILLAH